MEGEVNKQVWFFENEQVPTDPISICGGKQGEKLSESVPELGGEVEKTIGDISINMSNSLEVFLPDDQIIKTQGVLLMRKSFKMMWLKKMIIVTR
jgi:hypothetical protein